MRFIVDECTGPSVANWLRNQRHDVFSVYQQSRGADDSEIMQRAVAEDRIIITNDKDFGEKVHRERRPHRGVVLLRLKDERAAGKIRTIERLLVSHADQLSGRFVVVTEHRVRFARQL